MTRILTVTMNPALDVTTTTPTLIPREKLRCSQPTVEAGGGGVNVSRVIAELGGASQAMITSGGHTGSAIEALLRDAGLEPIVFPIADLTRESIMVYETGAQTQYRFVMPGPELAETEWQGALAFLSDLAARLGEDESAPAPDTESDGNLYIVASGSLPRGAPDDFYGQLAGIAAGRGARFILDTSGAALEAALMSPIHVLKLDEEEFRDLTGSTYTTDADEERCAREVLAERTGAKTLVITLGKRGALSVTANSCHRLVSPQVKPISTVGAGDSFLAAATLALSKGWSPERACQYGVAAGAAAVLTPGTQLVRRADVERLFADLGREA